MKNKIILRVASLVLATLLFSTCETPMEKSQNAYDASMVIPAVLSVSGPALALQTFTYDFQVTYFRAGSTWNWSAVDATVQSVSNDTKTATILFDVMPASGKAQVIITETTAGGTTSLEKIVEVTVDPFCPLTIDEFVGTWDVVETGDKPRTSVVTIARGSGNDDIVIQPAGGAPGLLGQVFIDWEEEFQDAFPPAGAITLKINLNNGVVTIPFDYWGQTLPGPWDYWYFGSGTWDGCGTTPKITIEDINLDWDGSAPGSAQYTNSAVLTKQAP